MLTPAHALPERRISVRPHIASDRAFILELARRFGEARAAWRTNDEVVLGTKRQLGAALDAMREIDAMLVAVDERGDRLGFAFVVTHDDFFTGERHAHLSELAVASDGSGAGSALIAAAQVWSRERGYRYLSLNVNDANVRAQRFYESHAFIPEYRHLIKLL